MDNKSVNRTIRPRKKYNRNCTNCEHAKYDDVWGEFKCNVSRHRCGGVELVEGCRKWVEKKTQN